LVQCKVRSVQKCGRKPDGQRKALLEQLRQERKRKKSEEEDPPYVPEEVVPRKKNRKSASNTDVRFVCSVILFVNTDEFI
jgi:hypothetical protein